MSRRRALIKIFLFSLAFVFLRSELSFSQETVGDLLKKIDTQSRGGKVKSLKRKSRTLVPRSYIPKKKIKKVNLRAIKPPKTNRLLYAADENLLQLEKITDEGIKELFLLVRKFKNSRNRGELWLRLAELYNEKAKLVEFRLQDQYDERLKKYFKKKLKKKPKLNLSLSTQYYKKSINLYELYLRDFKGSRKTDQVYYYLGTNYFQVNQFKKGSRYYEILSKNYPKSPYVTEARFYLGDFYFENENWRKAHSYFKMVLKRERSRLYSFALYKSAWCYFRLGQTNKAIAEMKRFITFKGLKKSVKKLRLGREAFKDLVVFYAENGNYKEARSFFTRKAGDNAGKYIEKLAYFYSDRGERTASRDLFKFLISQNFSNPKAFDYQYQVVLDLLNASKSRLFRKELFLFVDTYGPGGSWHRLNNNDSELIAKAEKAVESTLRNYVLRQHQAAQNSRDNFLRKLAEDGYKKYLRLYSKSKHSVEMHFFYGELSYDSGRYQQAAKQYRYVATAGQSKYQVQAADNYLLALEKSLPSDASIQAQVGRSLKPLKFSPEVVAFEKGTRWFLKKYPNSNRKEGILFRLGRIHYLHNHFNKAISIFREITRKYPQTKYAEYSANLMLDIYNLRGDYKGLERVGRELLKNPYLAKSSVGREVRKVVENASFKRAQDLQGGKKYSKSAEMFSLFAKENLRSSLAPLARFNAGVNYVQAGLFLKGIEMYSQALATVSRKNKKVREQSHEQLALLYSDLGNYEQAAVHFEALAKLMVKKNPRKASSYFFNAAVIWDGFRYWSRALVDYDSYIHATGRSLDPQVYFLKAEIYRKRKNWRAAARQYELFLRSTKNLSAKAEAFYKISQAYKNQKKTKTWRYWLKQLVGNRAFLKSGVRWVSKARLELAEEKLRRLQGMKIPRGRRQQKVVQAKMALLAQLNKDLGEIIVLDYPEGIVGALTLSGLAHGHMASAFTEAPLPKGLNAKEKKMYIQGVNEKLIRPQKDKAVASYSSAVKKSLQLDAFSNWSRLATKQLQRLEPQKNKMNLWKPRTSVVEDRMGL